MRAWVLGVVGGSESFYVAIPDKASITHTHKLSKIIYNIHHDSSTDVSGILNGEVGAFRMIFKPWLARNGHFCDRRHCVQWLNIVMSYHSSRSNIYFFLGRMVDFGHGKIGELASLTSINLKDFEHESSHGREQ